MFSVLFCRNSSAFYQATVRRIEKVVSNIPMSVQRGTSDTKTTTILAGRRSTQTGRRLQFYWELMAQQLTRGSSMCVDSFSSILCRQSWLGNIVASLSTDRTVFVFGARLWSDRRASCVGSGPRVVRRTADYRRPVVRRPAVKPLSIVAVERKDTWSMLRCSYLPAWSLWDALIRTLRRSRADALAAAAAAVRAATCCG